MSAYRSRIVCSTSGESRRRSAALRPAAARALIEPMEQRILLAMPTLWTTDGPGGGGALYGAVIAPNGQDLWCSSDMTGIYHSRDYGQSWQMVNFHTSTGGVNGGSLTEVQFTSDPNTVYIADPYANYLKKSTDGGGTWSSLSGWTNGTPYWIGTDLSTTTKILVSNGSNLYVSSNGGTSFTSAYTSSNLYVAGVFFDGSNVYVGTNKGLLTSSNGGTSFSLAAQQPGQTIMSFTGAKQGSTVRLLVLTTSDSPAPDSSPEFLTYGGAYRLDVGGSWVNVSAGIASGEGPHYISMAQNNISIAYTGGFDPAYRPQVLKSTDGGSTFADVFFTRPWDVVPNASNKNIATGYEGQNGDFDWSWGGEASGFAVCATDANKAIIAQNFIHVTSDGGTSWQQAYEIQADSNPMGQDTPQHKAYHGVGLTETSVHYLTWMSSSNIMASYTDIQGWRSTDGGASWSFPTFNGLVQNTLYKTLYSGGLLYGAASNVHDMYQSTHLTDAQCNPSGQYGAVIVSADQGATWSNIHSFGVPIVWIQIDPNNANRMYACAVDGVGSNGGIWVTSNLNLGASSTWTKLANPPRTQGHPYDLYVLNDGTLVATYSGRRTTVFTDSSGVFISTDGGTTWTDRTGANMHWYTKEITIDPTDPTQNTWYAGVFNGWGGAGNDMGDLYRTTDRGVNWTKMNLGSVIPTQYGSISVDSATINPATKEMYVTSESYGLLYTPDVTVPGLSASNFSDLTSFPFGTNERVFINPYNSQDVWVASFGGGIVRGGVAPSNLAASAVSSSQINLTWADNSSNETGFAIDRATDSAFTQNRVTTTAAQNATSASISGLNPSTLYYFRVRATNGANASANSSSASATTQASQSLPAAPSGLTASASSSSQVNLSWTDNANNENGFYIDRATDSGFTANVVTTSVAANVTSYSATPLIGGTTFYFRVRAYNGAGSSANSNTASAATLAAPAMPAGLKALWRFDEGSGTSANDTDTDGTADTGTLNGSLTWATGKIGKALTLSGSSQYVQVANSTDLNISGSTFSTAMWVKSGATNWNGTTTFISKGNGYRFGGVSGSKNIRFMLYIGGAWKTLTYTNSGDISTNWHHYAATYDGANMRIWVDGTNVASMAQTGTIGSNTSVLYLGRLSNSYLNGSMDEVRVYNTVLSSTDVTNLYNQSALSVTGLTVNSGNSASYSVQDYALAAGISQYGDQTKNFTTIPSKYLGSTFIRTAFADNTSTASSLLTFTLNQPVLLYVAFDDAIATRPAWLTASFTDTADNIVTAQGTFSVYKLAVSSGTITLGGPGGLSTQGMYNVFYQNLL